tara:strand:+ start:345 stop:713 length:369 start_codon:yes stop_codon:yes gene_type:complete
MYEYQCESCGFEFEKLQKMTDRPLTHCPRCGNHSLVKLISAAGFQLKGTGWYVTDFKDKKKKSTPQQNSDNKKLGDEKTNSSPEKERSETSKKNDKSSKENISSTAKKDHRKSETKNLNKMN